MLPVLKRKAVEALLVAADVAGMVASLAGASVVAPHPSPTWTRPVSALLACAEVTLLVEATSLPVRFIQPSFEPWHWALVAAALTVAYSLHVRLFRALVGKNDVRAQP
jgi:hypothetical protein